MNELTPEVKALLTAIIENIETVNIGKDNGQDDYQPIVRIQYIADELDEFKSYLDK